MPTMLEAIDLSPERARQQRGRRVSLPVDCACGERLAHRQGGRLVTYRVYTTVRSDGRVTLTCPRCRARTDTLVGPG
jgi:hypothetical protein